MPGANVDPIPVRLRRRAPGNPSGQLMIAAAHTLEAVEQIMNDPKFQTDAQIRDALRRALFKIECSG